MKYRLIFSALVIAVMAGLYVMTLSLHDDTVVDNNRGVASFDLGK